MVVMVSYPVNKYVHPSFRPFLFSFAFLEFIFFSTKIGLLTGFLDQKCLGETSFECALLEGANFGKTGRKK